MFTRIEQVTDFIQDTLNVKAASLGLRYIGYGDEQALPQYPAVVVLPGATTRDIYATRQFKNTFNVELYIYHARVSVGRAIRTKEDLELVQRVVAELHSNKTFDSNLIFGFVDSENPGILATQKGDAVVGTRITWRGEAVEYYDMP